MRIAYFTHSLRSCWNHGNAHFLRGLMRALKDAGHRVDVLEPALSWSATNLEADQGRNGFASYEQAYPDLASRTYTFAEVEALADQADVVIVHEWTEPAILRALGRLRRESGSFLLFYHDTHHRPVSDPDSVDRDALADYDAILAFGESLSRVYRDWGFTTFTWHEAADITHFYPRTGLEMAGDVAWIGNWGDDERTEELEEFLFRPVGRLGLSLTVRGVRYPSAAIDRLDSIGARYGGWIANSDAPDLFGRHLMTVHVPRRFYVEELPGIPTIRVFEALACGIPLVSAYWPDAERLFRPGQDYLVVRDGQEMTEALQALSHDEELRLSLVESGLQTVRERHTCRHRAEELLQIIGMVSSPERQASA